MKPRIHKSARRKVKRTENRMDNRTDNRTNRKASSRGNLKIKKTAVRILKSRMIQMAPRNHSRIAPVKISLMVSRILNSSKGRVPLMVNRMKGCRSLVVKPANKMALNRLKRISVILPAVSGP